MKTYKLIIKVDAKSEIIDAYNWYESKQDELGERFINTLDDYFLRIKTNPENFPKILDNMQQVTIKEFPYIIIFEIEKNDAIVFAVFNTNQNPEKWHNRNK